MNINVKLDKNFTTAFNKLCEDGGEQLRKLNGFADSQLNFTDFIDNFVDKNTVSDATIDGNANVGTKDMVSLLSEMHKPHTKLLAFNKIFYELNKKYGYKTACDWLQAEWNGDFYLHDSASSTMIPYCFAYDIEQLVTRGLFFIDGFNAQPPKHLVTYTDFVGEFVSWTSNRSSGACGLPSFLVYSFYFWKKDVENGYYTKSPEYYRDQEFQRIIYKLNQPYLRVNQSAFTNFSIFDDAYLVELFGGKEFPDGSFIIDYIDDIMEYQKAFMRVCADVRGQNAMTFPVLTFALLKKDGKWGNEEFAKWCCRHNMRWADSNFYISESVTALSNCCLKGDEVIVVKNLVLGTEEVFAIKDFVSLFNDCDEAFIKQLDTKYEIKSFNYDKMCWENKKIIGLVRKHNNYDFMLEFNINGKNVTVTPDHVMEVVEKNTGLHKKISAIELSRHISEYLIMIND